MQSLTLLEVSLNLGLDFVDLIENVLAWSVTLSAFLALLTAKISECFQSAFVQKCELLFSVALSVEVVEFKNGDLVDFFKFL